jgi:hypothetical protein
MRCERLSAFMLVMIVSGLFLRRTEPAIADPSWTRTSTRRASCAATTRRANLHSVCEMPLAPGVRCGQRLGQLPPPPVRRLRAVAQRRRARAVDSWPAPCRLARCGRLGPEDIVSGDGESRVGGRVVRRQE